MKTVNEELTLRVDDEGIRALGMDPSHVAMIDILIKPGLFDTFEKPKEKMITVNLAEFYKFLDRIDKDERVMITHSMETARLTLEARKGGRSRRFALPVLEPLDDEVPEPKIFFKSEGRILTQSVERALKDADLVSEFVKIMLTKEMLLFNATGDMGSARNEWQKGSDELLQLKSEEDSSATFTLSYLKDMFGQLKNLAEVVTLSLTDDMPLKIEAEANEPNVEITLYLAPCIGV
jgi:proliferating cell nuclear antigen